MTFSMDEVHPAGDHVLVRKCVRGATFADGTTGIARADGTPLLVFDQVTADTTQWVEIVEIGPNCKQIPQTAVGAVMHSPEVSHELVNVRKEWWIIAESVLVERGRVAFKGHDIIPLADIVVLDSESAKKDGDLWLSDGARTINERGMVLAVGPGRLTKKGVLIPPQVLAGQAVMIDTTAATLIDYQSRSYAVLPESAILCVLD